MATYTAEDRVDVYLVSGGRFHDFDYAREQLLGLLGEHPRVRSRVGADFSDLHGITSSDLLISYTCDVRTNEEQQLAIADYRQSDDLVPGGKADTAHSSRTPAHRAHIAFAKADSLAGTRYQQDVSLAVGERHADEPVGPEMLERLVAWLARRRPESSAHGADLDRGPARQSRRPGT